MERSGQGLRLAIRAYQKGAGLPETGDVNEALLRQLFGNPVAGDANPGNDSSCLTFSVERATEPGPACASGQTEVAAARVKALRAQGWQIDRISRGGVTIYCGTPPASQPSPPVVVPPVLGCPSGFEAYRVKGRHSAQLRGHPPNHRRPYLLLCTPEAETRPSVPVRLQGVPQQALGAEELGTPHSARRRARALLRPAEAAGGRLSARLEAGNARARQGAGAAGLGNRAGRRASVCTARTEDRTSRTSHPGLLRRPHLGRQTRCLCLPREQSVEPQTEPLSPAGTEAASANPATSLDGSAISAIVEAALRNV